MNRNDRKLLLRVYRTNGGGYDTTAALNAPVKRLLAAELVRWKPNHPGAYLIHTPAGHKAAQALIQQGEKE